MLRHSVKTLLCTGLPAGPQISEDQVFSLMPVISPLGSVPVSNHPPSPWRGDLALGPSPGTSAEPGASPSAGCLWL